jgi:hypothetical protein
MGGGGYVGQLGKNVRNESVRASVGCQSEGSSAKQRRSRLMRAGDCETSQRSLSRSSSSLF